MFAGVPVILNRQGASDILEIHMTEDEQTKWQASTDVIKEFTNKIRHYYQE